MPDQIPAVDAEVTPVPFVPLPKRPELWAVIYYTTGGYWMLHKVIPDTREEAEFMAAANPNVRFVVRIPAEE